MGESAQAQGTAVEVARWTRLTSTGNRAVDSGGCVDEWAMKGQR